MSKKCKCCGKEMDDAEYIKYLEMEVERLNQELAIAKLPPINIPPVWPTTPPWSPPLVWNTCHSCGG